MVGWGWGQREGRWVFSFNSLSILINLSQASYLANAEGNGENAPV